MDVVDVLAERDAFKRLVRVAAHNVVQRDLAATPKSQTGSRGG